MSGTFSIEWLPGGILLMRRSGVLTLEEAEMYSTAGRNAMLVAPPVWAILVDTRDAKPHDDKVQTIIQGLLQHSVERNVVRVAIITSNALVGIEQRRLALAPALVDVSTVAFYTDFDTAISELNRDLAG